MKFHDSLQNPGKGAWKTVSRMIRIPLACFLTAAVFCTCTVSPEISGISLENDGGALQPPLRKDIFEYLVGPVPRHQETYTLRSVAVSPGSTLEMDGRRIEPDSAVTFDALEYGPNYRQLTVTARNGKRAGYRLNVYRSLPLVPDDGEARFADPGDGTIIDTATGLVWMKDGDRSGPVSWAGAFDFIERLNNGAGGNSTPYADWRMPNVVEIRSLVNRGAHDKTGVLEEHGFRNMSGLYWTSTTYALDRSRAWTALFTNTHTPLARPKTGYCSVLPVRSLSNLPKSGADVPDGYAPHAAEDGAVRYGVPWPVPRFRENAGGTITDNMTGLVWMKNDEKAGELKNWRDAAEYIESLNGGGPAGTGSSRHWRMPTMAELDTLAHFGSGNGVVWLEENGFTNINDFIWSATAYPYAGNDLLMWGMLLMNGLDTGLTRDLESVGLLPVAGGGQ